MGIDEFAEVLMAKDRKDWQDAERIIDILKISDRMKVADLGCGPGFFTIPFSKTVGANGVVYAVDSSTVMLSHLRSNLKSFAAETMENVKIIQSDITRTDVPSESADVVFFANVLHDIQDKPTFFKEVKRISNSEATIVDIDWQKRAMPLGPPLEIRLSEDDSRHIINENGLVIVRAFDAGPYHYGFVCTKK